MMERRLKRQRLISVSSYYVSPQPDIPATFDLLNDDTKRLILKFVGNMSYATYGGINKHCRDVYINTKGMKKKTFVFGYASLSVIIDKIESAGYQIDSKLLDAVAKGVVLYNRSDILYWALQQRKKYVLREICDYATGEGRIDILDEVWNHIMNDEDCKRYAFEYVDYYAARGGKLDVLKWLETKGLPINKRRCAYEAARYGHLHFIQWLREERGLELYAGLYNKAACGGQLHVMKWLREHEVDWDEYIFSDAALKGNLNILQWLHSEGCPWPDDDEYNRVPEEDLKPEVIDWLRVNGYGDRLDSDSDDE